MKKISYFFIVMVMFTSMLYSQKLTVVKTEKIIDKSQANCYFPKLSPDGSKLFFTTSNFKGLWYYDFGTKNIVEVTSDNGAGYEYSFSKDGRSVFYRLNNLNDRGLRVSQSIIKRDLNSFTSQVIASGAELSTPKVLINSNVAFTSDYKITVKSSDPLLQKSSPSDIGTEAFACIEHQKITLYKNGNKKILAPLGEGNYIWPSVSPDGTKLLFTLAGRGTYISDLEGNILVSLGYADAPKWSPDNNWVMYMVDRDNGLEVTSSDIYASSSDGKLKYQLTDTKDIHEMYPEWSSDIKKAAFHSEDGSLYIIELKAE